MSWNDILGHDHLVEQFRRCVKRGRLAHGLLFVGPQGIGKFAFAKKLAQSLLCQTHDETTFQPCGACASCQQVTADTHPDFLLVTKPRDKNFIPIELLIGDKEHRRREGLCQRFGLRPFQGGRKIAVIDEADFLNIEGANSLLKTLEEPPPSSVLILIGTSEQKQLPTIRSRCQIVRFQRLPDKLVEQLLLAHNLVHERDQARELAQLAGGSLHRALVMTDPELVEFRRQLLEHLADPIADGVQFASALGAFVDQAGKDAPSRRQRIIEVADLAVDFYRQLLRDILGDTPLHGDVTLQNTIHAARDNWYGDELSVVDRLERCLVAIEHVRANANQATLLESWVDDLAHSR